MTEQYCDVVYLYSLRKYYFHIFTMLYLQRMLQYNSIINYSDWYDKISNIEYFYYPHLIVASFITETKGLDRIDALFEHKTKQKPFFLFILFRSKSTHSSSSAHKSSTKSKSKTSSSSSSKRSSSNGRSSRSSSSSHKKTKARRDDKLPRKYQSNWLKPIMSLLRRTLHQF